MGSVVYIIDTHALLSMQDQGWTGEQINHVYDGLTSLVVDKMLTFPQCVVRECKRIAAGERVYLWVNSVSSSRHPKNCPWEYQEQVMALCPNLIDDDDPEEQTPVEVAAMALRLRESVPVEVVTDDATPLPTRDCLKNACLDLGVKSLSLVELLERHSILP
ncbi:hypothetical protein ACWEKJ_40830 [Amycolatopsis thermoflava]